MIGEYKIIQEKAQECGPTPRQVQNLCSSGRIPGEGEIWGYGAFLKRPKSHWIEEKLQKNTKTEEKRRMTHSVVLRSYTKGSKVMFKCDKCGLCCMHIDESKIDDNLNRGDGVCRHFDDETLLCKIYNERPVFCNVDKFYDEFLSLQYSKEDFYSVNYESCKILKERYGE